VRQRAHSGEGQTRLLTTMSSDTESDDIHISAQQRISTDQYMAMMPIFGTVLGSGESLIGNDQARFECSGH
jgi:hypothetical protein